jgi:hypothetical protein
MVCLFVIVEGNLGNIKKLDIGGLSVVDQYSSNSINLLNVSKLLRPFNEIPGFFNQKIRRKK